MSALPLAALATALALGLAGCATPVPAPTDGTPNEWSGRFAATVHSGAAEPERSSGRYLLRADGVRAELELASPLGQTVARISLDEGQATLVTADGKSIRAASAEALTEEAFGWRVPLANLAGWLEGRIAQPTEREGERVVAGFERGWSVRVETHDGQRPRRLALDWPAGAGPGERRLTVRLMIDEARRTPWQP